MKIKQGLKVSMNKIFTSIKCLFTPILCAFLGAFAGAEGTSKNWRRFLIPFALSGLAYGHLKNLWVITIMAMMGAFSIGYGIPDETDEGSGLGRFWQKIAEKIVYTISGIITIRIPSVTQWQDMDWNGGLQTFKEKIELFTNILTRGTISLMIGLSLISIPILKGNWTTYFIGCLFIKLAYVICSWRDLGGIWINKIWKCKNGHKKDYEEEVLCWKCGEKMIFKGKYLLVSDIVTYGMIGIVTTIIIYY